MISKVNVQNMISFNIYIYAYIIFVMIIIIAIVVLTIYDSNKVRKKLDELVQGEVILTPEEFFEVRNSKQGYGSGYISTEYAVTGVYVLLNESKKMYYVGQGKNVMTRVNSHLTGRGNGDVYADYKYGDEFTIKMISLVNSGYHNVNDLERELICYYDSHRNGYNKTRGNRS